MSNIRPTGMPLLGGAFGYPASTGTTPNADYNGFVNYLPKPTIEDCYAADGGNSGDSVTTQLAQMQNNAQDTCAQALSFITGWNGGSPQCIPMMGIIFHMTSETPQAGMTAIVNGQRDANYAGQDYVNGVKDTHFESVLGGAGNHGYFGTWWVRLWWEYNLDSGMVGNEALFVQTFQYLYTMIQKYNSLNGCNIRVIWNPGGGPNRPVTYTATYPGAAYYDVVGIDDYMYPVNDGGGYDTDPQDTDSSSSHFTFIDSLNYAINDNKTWAGCEIGFSNGGSAGPDINGPPNLATLLAATPAVLEIFAIWSQPDGAYDPNNRGWTLDWWNNSTTGNAVGAMWLKIYNAKTSTTSLTIITPVQQWTTATFVVSGTIVGYSTVPTLNYSDNGSTWQALPSGSTVTRTAFSFTHPGIATAGNYNVYVRDAGATSVSIESGTFVVAVLPTGPRIVTTTGLGNASYPLTITATPSPIILGGPFTLAAAIVVTGGESAAGTRVTTVGPQINASPTPGTAGFGNLIAISSGAQITVNGTVVGGANVTQLYYIGDTCFQYGGGNWYGPITASSTGNGTPAPQPTIALSNNAIAAGLNAGTTVGTLTTAVGAGTYTWTYSLSGTDAGSFQLGTGGVLQTGSSLAAKAYAVTVTATPVPAIVGGPFTLAVTVTAT